MYYVGIDLGTSSVKMILCDKNGKIINTITRDYLISFPYEGYSEQSPEDWYEKVIEGLEMLTTGVGDKVKALSIAGQMHGLVMLDEFDNVIRPCILWNDSRSVKECEILNSEKMLPEWTGNIAFPGFTAPKILWVKNNEKENFEKCRKIMLPKDYVVYRLTGEFVTEMSDAAGMLLFDVKNKCYSKEMLEICQIEEKMLPKVLESYLCCGKVKKSIAEKLGWGDVKVAPGAGDNAAAAIGMGVIGDGGCSISLGTSGTVFVSSEEYKKLENNAIHFFNHADGDYHMLGCMLSAASCNKWWHEDILNDNSYSDEGLAADGESKVFFLPYLMGERSPHNNPHLRGAFVGMSLDTTKAEMTKAVMEGVCYALRDCVEIAKSEGIKIDEVRLCGGGSKSEAWCRILANVLKVRVVKPVCSEGPSFGAAILAMVADGVYENVKSACESVVKMGETIEFDSEISKKYDKGYKRFKALFESLKEWY